MINSCKKPLTKSKTSTYIQHTLDIKSSDQWMGGRGTNQNRPGHNQTFKNEEVGAGTQNARNFRGAQYHEYGGLPSTPV